MADHVTSIARKYRIDPGIFRRLIRQESGGNQHAVSPAGAIGRTQLMPSTARALGVNPHDPIGNLVGGARYLRQQLDRFGGDYRKALAAYNAGPGAVEKYGGVPPFAETKNYVRSILGGSTPHAPASSGSSSDDNDGLASTLRGSVTPGAVTGGGFDPGSPTDVPSLADLLTARPQPVAPQLPAAPFSSSKYLHMGQAPVVTAPSAPESGVDSLLAQIQGSGQEIPQTSVSAAKTTVSGSAPTAHASSSGSGRTPTGRLGQIIGTPHTGTHTLGNWQSDNAVDIKVPEGTPMVALQDGVIVKVRHHPQDGGRFAGDQITVRGANGNEYFYAHGKAAVKAGQRIRKGQSLGVTGSANGTPHLHFGQMRGDPRQHVRSR